MGNEIDLADISGLEEGSVIPAKKRKINKLLTIILTIIGAVVLAF